MATIDDLKKLDLRIGTVRNAERLTWSDKLIKLTVGFGADGERVILAGIAKWYAPEELIGKQMPFVFNLDSRKMGELESQGMMLAADGGDGAPILLHPNRPMDEGSPLR